MQLADTNATELTVRLAVLRETIDDGLEKIAAAAVRDGGLAGKATASCLLAPGKRLRPTLTLLAAEALGGTTEMALGPACAVEMVHAASLVLDDLPCMDDAKLRRGQPACHLVFGEDIAILAAFALLNDTYRVVGDVPNLPPAARTRLVTLLSDAVGFGGLISGQERDLHGAGGDFDRTHGEKTGALFIAAAKAGAIVAGGTPACIDAVGDYARHLGLAYQTYDDFLDSYGDTIGAGKDVGRDNGHTNVVSLVGRDRAIKRITRQVQQAVAALAPCGPAADPLAHLARTVMERAHALSRGADVAHAAAG